MDKTVLPSPAKINLGLAVLSQRADGYHNLHTLFQELTFHDTITLSPIQSGCEITSDFDGIPLDESNLAFCAWSTLKKSHPEIGGVKIHLEKRIPVGAGLGGGSSNAATVLKGLNTLYSLSLSQRDLEKIGTKLGADVPFFIRGGLQLGEGIGDKLTPIKGMVPGQILLVVPPFSISTVWAYETLKNDLNEPRHEPNFARVFKKENFSFSIFENDFERIVIPAHPEIGTIKQKLLDQDAVFASLSGSGSTVYGIFDEEAQAKRAESALKPFGRTILTQPASSFPAS